LIRDEIKHLSLGHCAEEDWLKNYIMMKKRSCEIIVACIIQSNGRASADLAY